MTAIRSRRTRTTVMAFVAAVVGLLAVGGLAYAGVENLVDSRAGRVIDTSLGPAQTLPFTSTALVATVDDVNRITSVAALVLEPDGAGGSIVNLSPSADASSGTIDALAPLAAVYAVDGPDAFLSAAESVTGLSFDLAEVVDAERFADLIKPLGELSVRLPTDLRDASTEERWDAGDTPLTPEGAAAAVTATDPGIADWYLDPGREAVWAAVADRVGAGVGSVDAAAPAVPATLDEFLQRLFADRVDQRSLTSTAIRSGRVADQLSPDYAASYGDSVVSVVAHDRAELVLVFGSIAPARMGAPLEAPTFRLLSDFDTDELSPLGMNDADVARAAINRLLYTKVNVVSFGQPTETPDITLIEVADEAALDGIEETYGDLFGESDVRVATNRIEGIDVQITLGRSFLTTLEES